MLFTEFSKTAHVGKIIYIVHGASVTSLTIIYKDLGIVWDGINDFRIQAFDSNWSVSMSMGCILWFVFLICLLHLHSGDLA